MKNSYLLTILIPTFNRCHDLGKNLSNIIEIILSHDLQNSVNLVISDNNSSDNTESVVHEYINNYKLLDINYFKQSTNAGVAKNCSFVFNQANGKYVMYLGDDDFFNEAFLLEVLEHLNNSDIQAVIPNFIPVNNSGEITGRLREPEGENILLKKGFKSCLKHSWKAHQLSGIIFKRSDASRAFENVGMTDNMYIFIFFMAHSLLNGNGILIRTNPIKVTQPDKSKDWGYGKDGLIREIFTNYNKLPISSYKKYLLQKELLIRQPWRFLSYKKHGLKVLIKVGKNIMFRSGMHPLLTIYFPLLMFKKYLNIKFYRTQ